MNPNFRKSNDLLKTYKKKKNHLDFKKSKKVTIIIFVWWAIKVFILAYFISFSMLLYLEP